MSYGELNSNLKVQYDEMMRLQELIKGNKVTEEEKGAVDDKIRALSSKCVDAQNALDERAGIIKELGSNLAMSTNEVNDLINHIRGVEKARLRSLHK